MRPLARERRRVSSAIDNIADGRRRHGGAARRAGGDLRRLPRFLRRAAADDGPLGALADADDARWPTDLGAVAPDINRFVAGLGPVRQRRASRRWTRSARPARRGIPAVQAALPVIKDPRALAAAARPVGATLADLLVSFQRNDGIERAMDFLFYRSPPSTASTRSATTCAPG